MASNISNKSKQELNEGLLKWSSQCNLQEVVTCLQKGADVNYREPKNGKTPLYYAAENGHIDIFLKLLQTGADPNLADALGRLPLHCAAVNEHAEIVLELLNNGSDPNSVDKNGQTPLHLAARNGSIRTLSELIKRGSDLHMIDYKGLTPLHCAVISTREDIVSELLKKGSDPKVKDISGKSAFDLARPCFKRSLLQGKSVFDTTKPSFERLRPQEYQENVRLLEELRGLGLENVNDLQELLHESSQKCFWSRVSLVGPYSVGKSCLAKILVGETIPLIRQSTDGIWIYMGRAGMNVDKMEWIFFAKGNAITEVLTNMLISISTSETKTCATQHTLHAPIFSTKNNDDTMNTNISITDSQSTDVKGTSFVRTINISKTSKTDDDQQPLLDGLSSNTTNEENTLPAVHLHGVTYNQKIKQIPSEMSINDKIHQLIVQAVQEGKYKQKIVPIDIWDFGGQKDYYMTHQLFITSRGIFVLMFNGSIDLHKLMPDLNFLPGHFGKPTVAVYLVHWVNSILTYCKRTDEGFPRIIFVATHKDEKWFKFTREARRKHLEHELQKLFQSHAGSKHLEFKPLIYVDATNPKDQEIANLKIKLMEKATENPRWGELMPTLWVPLELQLALKSAEGENIITRIELVALNTKNESLVLSERQLETFLKVQHSLGKLVYFDVEHLRDLIIISPAYLVEVLRSIVTEKQFWPQGERCSLILRNLQESGIIERDDIYFLWKQKKFKHILQYKEFILQILVHLDVMIASRSSFEDASCSLQDVSRFLVPCMISKGNDTLFLEKFWKSNNSIILAYTFTEEMIPPAMSYRFLSSLIASWDIKQYEESNTEKRMLFSDLAVVQIDSLHDLAIQVKTNRLIVSLIHATTTEKISSTLASSLQECLTAAIVRITEFYSTLASDVKSADVMAVLPFNIEFGVFCNSDICFFSHNEMPLSSDNPVWICKKHKQRHATKGLTAWFSDKEPKEVCTSSCKGLGRLEGEKCPLPQHIRRIAAALSPDECRELAILLGFQLHEWEDLEYQLLHQPSNDIKFMALWSCVIKSGDISFDNLRDVLENKGISSHLLCRVFRDVTIDALDMTEETLNKIPSVDVLLGLSNHIGNSTMQLAIELEVDLSYIQQIQHDHKNKLIEQTRKILMKWRQNKFPRPTIMRLLKALYRVGKFGPTYQIIKNYL